MTNCCTFNYPTIDRWPPFPGDPYYRQNTPVYICDGCSKATNYPVYVYVNGNFGYYCSVSCAKGERPFTITWKHDIQTQYN